MTPDAFAKRFRTIATNVAQNASTLQDKTALAVLSAVVIGTPVDTGRAAGNWQVAFGDAAEGTIDNPVQFGPTSSILRGEQKLRSGGDRDSSFLRPQRDIHITNNLPYITPLNEGHSKKAPAGFVEMAIEAGAKAVNSTAIIEGRNVSAGRYSK